MVLMPTDLPEPVCRRSERWGIFARSATIGWPPMSFPTAKARLEGVLPDLRALQKLPQIHDAVDLIGGLDAHSRLSGDGSLDPDVGGRRVELDIVGQGLDLADLHSLLRMELIPGHSGPQLILVTVTPTPKFRSVCCNLMAVSLNSFSDWPEAAPEPLLQKSSSGGAT